jgi:hypothetical protein
MTVARFYRLVPLFAVLLFGAARAQSEDPRPWTYNSERDGHLLTISYDFRYLNSFKRGRNLMNYYPNYKPSDGVVDLDFKFNNTTTKNAFATSVNFKINKSAIVNEAIPYVEGGRWSVSVGNIGWAPMQGVRVSYAVATRDQCTTQSTIPSKLRSSSARFATLLDTRVGTFEIKAEDVPSNWQKPYPNAVCVLGYLDYNSNGNSSHVPFAAIVQIGGPFIAGLVPIDGEFDLSLEAGREGYTTSVPIGDLICANSPGRFIVHLMSKRTASFDFDVTVRFTDGNSISLGSVRLDYFRPPQLADPMIAHHLISTDPLVPPKPPPPPSRLCPT